MSKLDTLFAPQLHTLGLTIVSVAGISPDGHWIGDEAHSTLERLMKREPPLVKVLPRLPGTKEARYAHLLSGDVETWEPEPSPEAAAASSSDSDRIARLEDEVAALQKEITDLKQQLAEFRKQFE